MNEQTDRWTWQKHTYPQLSLVGHKNKYFKTSFFLLLLLFVTFTYIQIQHMSVCHILHLIDIEETLKELTQTYT